MKRNELNAASHANHSGESGAMCCSPSLGQMSTYWPLAPYSMSGIRGVRCLGEWHASGGLAGWSGTDTADPIGEASDGSLLEKYRASRASKCCSVRCSRSLPQLERQVGELRLQRGHLSLHPREPGL